MDGEATQALLERIVKADNDDEAQKIFRVIYAAGWVSGQNDAHDAFATFLRELRDGLRAAAKSDA